MQCESADMKNRLRLSKASTPVIIPDEYERYHLKFAYQQVSKSVEPQSHIYLWEGGNTLDHDPMTHMFEQLLYR